MTSLSKTKLPKLCLCCNQLSDEIIISNKIRDLFDSTDLFVFESQKHARKVLKGANMHREFWVLSEHKEAETLEQVEKAFTLGQTVVYFSDHGNPGFEDPGHILVERAYYYNVGIEIHGCSSALGGILAAAPFPVNPFLYTGLLPKDKKLRIQKLKDLKKQKYNIVLLDTPYRFHQLIEEIQKVFSPKTNVVVAKNIGLENQEYFFVPVEELDAIAQGKKDLFMALVHNAN